ncbi:MAG TPA: nitroreductase/quinone reductase family protein [Alphaproteobacteria bacterium]|jgi:deazaflavin-dependent oxidoreductase (nitroreductase family)|nr:nitroreductase/quinone reductase family protein [Alphaproteobacteria bacterium]
MKFLFAIEKFLVRWFGVSLISWLVCRKAGVKPVTTFILTTVGRKSGRKVDTPIFYFRIGEGFYIIGSKGGAPEHPLWFRNLEANPQAWVAFPGSKIAVRARVAEGEERARLWDAAAVLYPPYNEYQARAGARKIPVVVLDRA